MKHVFSGFILSIVFVAATYAAQMSPCPFFGGYPEWGNSVSYNLNATPWNFELAVFGDTTGAHIQWYTFNSRGGETIKDTVPYYGPGYNTVGQCYPATDESVRGTWLDYVCVIKTASCPEGVESEWCDAQVANGGDCITMNGTSFTIQNGTRVFTEGDQIQLTAYFSAYGGFHYFTWYHDGTVIDSTAEHGIWNDPNNFNYSVLTIPASQLSDAGQYSVKVTDGSDISGSACTRTTSAVTITVNPKPEPPCQDFVYRKWDNLLFVDNGKDEYVAYQWYKDGVVMSGETRQYLHTNGVVLQGDGHEYHVEATTTEGKVVKSCKKAFADFSASNITEPKSIRRAVLFTNMGVKVGEWNEQPTQVYVSPGMYIWQYTDTQGHTWMNRVVY